MLFGVVLLLDNLGIVTFNVWGIIIPILIIALGIWILWGTLARRSMKTEHVDVQLEGAIQARIKFQHGAGRLFVDGAAGTGKVIEGDCIDGVSLKIRRTGDLLDITLSVQDQFFPFFWGQDSMLDWILHLAQDLPLELVFEMGAAETRIDLSSLRVSKIHLTSGASSTNVTLPANAGQTTADFNIGAASLDVRVPTGVAARIHTSTGLASAAIDKNRFPRSGSVYQSVDFEGATNRADIRVDAGIGSINIR